MQGGVLVTAYHVINANLSSQYMDIYLVFEYRIYYIPIHRLVKFLNTHSNNNF